MCEVLPIRKGGGGGGGGKGLSHAERGHTFFFGSFNAVALSFSHIEGGANSFRSLKGGWREKFYPVLSGACKQFWIRDSPILYPPSP